jgi:hypothetical protein
MFADLAQNHVSHTFEDNGEVWTSVKMGKKSLYQGTINISVWDDNMYESRGMAKQLNLYCFCWGCK